MQELVAAGETVNSANRNLIESVNKHWKNGYLGLGQCKKKRNIPQSKAASVAPNSEVDVEHSVPMALICDFLLECTNEQQVIDVLQCYFSVALVTKTEHKLLNKGNLRNNMPENWDGSDKMARYKSAEIEF